MQKLPFSLEELQAFLSKAAFATYAGDQKPDDETPNFTVSPEGFKVYQFSEGRFSYTDTYAGFFQSFGQEIICFDRRAVWVQNYGGGMREGFQLDVELAHKTFTFLKKAMSQKEGGFQPRGPKLFDDGTFYYSVVWTGDISRFSGSERICISEEGIVFEHQFFGGLIQWKE